MTPIVTNSNANSNFSLFTIEKAVINLIELSGINEATTGAHSVQLNVAGDINNDGRVDDGDRQQLTGALGRTAGDDGYSPALDINRDRLINSDDLQLLNQNFGFTVNLPPVVTSFSIRTHSELETTISLTTIATDPESDSINYSVLNAVNGTVQLNTDGQNAASILHLGSPELPVSR